MTKHYSNPCSRCGTERVHMKTWEEKTDSSRVVTREMVCPNPDCQSKVDSDNQKISDKHIAMKLRTEERLKQRKNRKPILTA